MASLGQLMVRRIILIDSLAIEKCRYGGPPPPPPASILNLRKSLGTCQRRHLSSKIDLGMGKRRLGGSALARAFGQVGDGRLILRMFITLKSVLRCPDLILDE
ncbi:hypothetical protein K2173_012776 [Erythroxylum novogranatense]|uniref:Uncharacterized protein n=1 Tax=Erythroxylum novogranatense TaxID=1862640 RepID=A0AAV8S4S4_9ROSI|nr:hypothetical protein K2173_012776 [Erythroxylum novogranatense]